MEIVPYASQSTKHGFGISENQFREIFGTFWLASGQQPPNPTLSDEDYKQHLNLNESYKNRSSEILTKIMTAAFFNQHNEFLVSVAEPLFPTSERHFHINHKEWNALPYTPLAEGGVDNQPTFSEWSTHSEMGDKLSQTVPISIDLSRDENFGARVWLENLVELNRNLLLTLMKSTARTLTRIGYMNQTQDMEGRFSVDRLFATEAHTAFIFANDANAGFDLIGQYMRETEGLNLGILPPGAERWFRDINESSTSRKMDAMSLYYDPVEKILKPKRREGPLSARTYRFGSQSLDVMVMRAFTVNQKDKRPDNPLVTKLCLCQFFPPNPSMKADDQPSSTNPMLLDMWIACQTKDRIEEQRIQFKEGLRNCFYWGKDGKISQQVTTFIAELNANLGVDKPPPQYSAEGGSKDINEDTADYNETTEYDIQRYGGDLTKMKSMRHKPVVAVYVPRQRRYRVAEYVGDNNLDTLPNKWILRAVRSLSMRFFEETGLYTSKIMGNLLTLLNNIAKAPVTRISVMKVIDANMPALLRNGSKTDNGIEEFWPDSNGSLRLPDNDDMSLNGMKYINGFQSGAGLLTLRDWQLRPGNAFVDMCNEASVVLRDVELLIAFIERYIGNSDVVNEEKANPWFITKTKTAAFIDAVFPGIPVFLGVPAAAQYSDVDGKGGQPARPLVDELSTFLWDANLSDTATIVDKVSSEVLKFSIVEAAVEALSCLSVDVGTKWQTAMLVCTAWGAENKKGAMKLDNVVYSDYKRTCDKLFKLIITTVEFPKKILANASDVPQNQKIVSAMADMFFSILQPVITMGEMTEEDKKALIKKADTYVEELTSAKNFKAKLLELTKSDAYKSNRPSFAAALANAMNQLDAKAGYPDPIPKSRADREKEREVRSQYKDGAVSYFEGNYATVPKQYLRSPLISSPALVDFIQETGFSWALPADPASEYTTPNFSVVGAYSEYPAGNRRDTKEWAGMGTKSFIGFHSRVADLGRHHKGGHSRGKPARRDIRGKHTASELFTFGKSAFTDLSDDDMAEDEETFAKLGKKSLKELAAEVLNDQYYGPWENRHAFCEKISGAFEKLMFKAIIHTPNELSVHDKLADVGAPLINLVFFRPFCEFTASGMILMKTGPEVIAKAISPVDVDISKNRGNFEVTCAFYQTDVVVDATKIRLIPYAFPESYDGGKKTDFLTSKQQFEPRNPNKPSIICMPTPVAERTYTSTTHMLNRSLTKYAPKKSEQPDWQRKLSCAPFYESVIGKELVNMIETLHQERDSFHKGVGVSHVAQMGPRTFLDQTTLQKVELEGYGAANSRRMNSPGGEQLWNHTKDSFPMETPVYKMKQIAS